MNRILWPILVLSIAITTASAATDASYTIEKLPDPPSKFETRQIDAIDFLPDGRLVVCLPSGEIFLYQSSDNNWSLFAEGLHNPLGVVAVANDELVIAQRPELTRVKDTDGDGKADAFEVMTDQFGMSGNYHEFHFTPVPDGEGGFFFALGTGSHGAGIRAIVRGEFDKRGRPGRMHASTPHRGWVMRYTATGDTIPWASGLRTPNGLGMDLQGRLFVTDNQGDWVGSSKLFHIEQGNFYGHPASLTWDKNFSGIPLKTPTAKLNELRTRACVVFPHGTMANSPTQVLAVTPEAHFGPFTGQLLVGEMNKPRVMRVMLEEIDGQLQGACVPFLDGKPLSLGINRLAWAPDGSLYMGSTKHTWSGSEGLRRVSWNGTTPFEVQAMTLTKTGFRFTFTKPIDQTNATDLANWPFKRYYYEYHEKYGSKQFDVSEITPTAVRISEDRQTVEVDLPELKAWYIHEVTIQNLQASDGATLSNNYLAYTLNRLLENTPPEPVQYSDTGPNKRR